MKTKALTLLFIAGLLTLTSAGCDQQDNKCGKTASSVASIQQMEENDEPATENESEAAEPAKKIKVSIDDSGLSNNHSVNVGDGERNYYKYDKAALGTVSVTLSDLPETLADIQNMTLPKGMNDIHDTPYLCPALLVCALRQAFIDKDECKAMLNYIGRKGHDVNTGIVDGYPSDWSQLFQYRAIPSILSYFEGATKQNSWTPSKPITMKMQLTQYSYTADQFVVRLLIKSAAKSSPQYIEMWMEDTDDDGNYDFFYPVNYINLAHSLGEY